ncbi:Nicotinate-nucleotide adenylyltransferase [Novipirellula galeiformis]|uniref:Probable nicotinate-nucleotide adenylyltransferase n=1 Tax=Novipirellula galeiformis TaxID=2528004 RepID=A0A5C6CQY6_9BACT|nr:nicotinate (nicotinamide) nucleotide adenylyltransferase [Novipirellula galeiformis]TWU26315.1 Nicotinate-nucleotide adenylyltransferase [Novipirellula galeiformis]
MRIGLFGGSFDPVHLGHLWIAEAARESLELDQVRWIPTATSPLKLHGAIASDQDRVQMLKLALSGDTHHEVDEREIERADVSYTVETVSQFLAEMPGTQFFLIIGSDSLATIRKWREPQRLLELITLAVVQRGGEAEIDFSVLQGLVDSDRIDAIASQVIKMPVIELSSSELRDRIAAGRSIRYRTPRSVEALIRARGLYRGEGNRKSQRR